MLRYFFLLSIGLFSFQLITAQESLRHGNLLRTHKLILSEAIGPTISRTDYTNIGLGYNIKVAGEYYYWHFEQHAIGGRLSLNFGEISASDPNRSPETHITTLYTINFGLLYGLKLESDYYPYASAGITLTYFDPRDGNRDKLPGNYNHEYSKFSSDIFIEAGLKYRLSSCVLLFTEATLYIDQDDLLDGYSNNDLADFYGTISFGISYAFTFEEDTDDDGIPDNWDKCPYTPLNIDVDDYGCPVDDDYDGIPDYRDDCPDTPVGIEVDRYGCAFDDDEDGIPNYIDDCADTPAGVEVDEHGCPLDGDGDGVPDYKDLCPDTEEGAEVDSSGCYKLDESKNYFKSVIIYFDSADSTISNVYFGKLDRLAYLISNYKDITWYIEGYKDNIEDSPENESISRIRAKAVWDYLVRKGAPPSKIRISDKGSGFAVGDNSTITGRSQNRRVVIFGIK